MNKVILSGNITRDIELRYTPNGKAVCDIGIANNDTKDKTAFIECVAWDKNAEFISKYFGKGKAILIEGSLIQDEWEDKDSGKKRTKTRVNIFRAEFQGKKEDGQAPQAQQPQAPAFGTQQHAQAQTLAPLASRPQQNLPTHDYSQQPAPAPQPQYQPQPASMAPPALDANGMPF